MATKRLKSKGAVGSGASLEERLKALEEKQNSLDVYVRTYAEADMALDEALDDEVSDALARLVRLEEHVFAKRDTANPCPWYSRLWAWMGGR